MATIINMITTVFLNRTELASGEYDRFPFKYILEDNGTITYLTKLTAGRLVESTEASIPGLGVNKTAPSPKDSIQPLAYGTMIPGEMFHQIKQFFLDVMDMGPSTYEAQVFIVWSEVTKEYRIVVPKQKVSAAAVRYDIGEMLSDTDVIICDIHSHNDMSAFFSGTDNKDDKKNPWISGVFGKLSSTFEHKFRFNDGAGRHFPMEASEVFYFGTPFTTPKEWLDQVEISTYTPVKNVQGIRTWNEALGIPEQGKSYSDWLDNPNVHMGEDDEWTLTSSKEDDLYDVIVDSLAELTNNECKAVLMALQDTLDNKEYAPTLSDREMSAFVDIHYTLTDLGDVLMASAALSEVLRGY